MMVTTLIVYNPAEIGWNNVPTKDSIIFTTIFVTHRYIENLYGTSVGNLMVF